MGAINYKKQKYGSISPGPGGYNPMNNYDVQLSYSMGKKLESSLVKNKPDMVPGPGNYEPSNKFNS